MNNVAEEIWDRIYKLKELAERGEGGEALNAWKMLNELLGKHGLTLADITGERQVVKTYVVNNNNEAALLEVVLSFVLKEPTAALRPRFPLRPGSNSIKLTEDQHGEAAALYVHHQHGLAQALDEEEMDHARKLEKWKNEIADMKASIARIEQKRKEHHANRKHSREWIPNVYFHKNGLLEHAGWRTVSGKEARGTDRAHGLTQNTGRPNELPAQRLGGGGKLNGELF